MRKSIRGDAPGIALFVASVSFLFAASCNLPDLPFLSNEKSVVEPDSARGDTTFYHHTVRYPDTTKVATFATFEGVWNFCRPHWVGGTNYTTYWLKVDNTVSLICVDNDPRTIAAADELIEKTGDTVIIRILQGNWGYTGLPAYSVRIAEPDGFLQADVPLFERMRPYDERPDIFKAVYPGTQVMLDKVSASGTRPNEVRDSSLRSE